MMGIPESINALGIAGFVVGVLLAAAAAIAFFRFDLPGVFAKLDNPMDIWTQPEPRRKFLTYVGLLAMATLVWTITLLFGGWQLGSGN